MRVFSRILLLLAVLISSSCSSDPGTYRLTTTSVPSEAGTITPADGEFDINRNLEISATPNEHWVFERWEGDYEGTENPVVINMDSDKDIAAVFAKRDYSLTINTEGEGTVSERVVQEKATDYPHGTVVELTAEPENGWEFSEWTGDLESEENPATVTIDGEMQVTAVFTRIEYPLTINIVGDGSVDEEIVQSKTDYPHGTTVELTAIPDSSWAFVEWEGDVEGTENPVEITIDEPKTVTVTFERSFRLTTLAIPEEGGTIEPSGGDYLRDTTFEVVATANEGWNFVEWRGDFTGTNPSFSLTMNGDKTIEAHFEPQLFSLETDVEGSGQVVASVLSGEMDDDQFEYNTVVELTAVADEGWQFVGWEGDATGTSNPTTVTMNGNKSVTAVFRFFDGGSGTVGNPYQVSTLVQLQAMQDYPDSYFILTQDIDVSETSGWNEGAGFSPIGTEAEPFSGGLNGDGFEISNLFINRPGENNIGLFGNIAENANAIIQNISLVNADITGNERVGAIAGVNGGEIIRSSVAGSVEGSGGSTGGLAGQNDGTIQGSFSEVEVSGNSNVGGLVGINNSDISKSYALGTISGTGNVGGLAGENAAGGFISETYAAGEVSAMLSAGGLIGTNNATIEISYWDTESTSQAGGTGTGNSDGMTGLSSAEMTGAAAETNMTDFNWMTTWTTSASYPVLQWQNE